MICGVCAIGLHYLILKFLSVNLFLWGHELANSFLLFSDRYRNHMTSFRHANRRNETELSKYIWTLKDARKPFRVQWKVLATCKPYDNVSKKCNLCLKEKFFIICRNDLCTLNKRNELASSCPHRNRFTLKNFKIR